ncbi:hypothetical protein ACH5RR_019648 [Cinchona calisaya]|uniref:Squalene cyclase N-terminal domain-containing protein n=1 Tax=Cinchona calisaya TaxID=153742 RepID=A0ABD2ZQ40_9GENT
MWRLKVAESEGNWFMKEDDYVGRRYWEFDPEAGTPEERAHVEKLRQHLWRNRFRVKHSANLLMRMQNEDGGWGIHIEGHSTMFSSVLNYLVLRLMGENLDQAALAGAKNRILDGNTCPGKVLARVYLPMSYLYGKSFVGKTTQVIYSPRDELYIQPHHKIDWNKARDMCAKGNTSQFWDVALSIHAIISSEFAEEYGATLAKAHDFLKKSQVTSPKCVDMQAKEHGHSRLQVMDGKFQIALHKG